jgi:zinc transport system ATP-binding protein
MPDLVEISDLEFAFGRQMVLRQINLTIESGSTLGLIGPNGGGKTTLIRLLLGQHLPSRGRITIAGMPPQQAVRQGDVIGYLPQNSRVSDRFPIDVKQVITLGLAGKTGMLRGYSRNDLRFVEELIDRVGVRDIAGEPVGSLSGGQLQRVLIARALAPRPRLLLLDEPTVGIDRRGQQHFVQFIQDLKQELDLTVVFVSHDLRAVASIADRIGCLNVTLHYHDVPEHLPADLVYSMFACDLEALGLDKRAPRQGLRLPVVTSPNAE